MLRLFRMFILLAPLSLYAQLDSVSKTGEESILSVNIKEHELSKKTLQDPRLLVAALTAGKSGEKEKFDAIFGWVVHNIRYNYAQYFSGSGSYPVPVRATLKARSAICLGYANLMDTLCGMAGITNTTVFGYAKDEVFDVHDSIYIDNHAWNAVKLDDLWYLYDMTWSTGTEDYELKRISKFVNRFLEKHPKSYKKKKFRNRFSRHADGCPPETKVGFYYKQRWMNRLFRGWLSHYAFRVKRKYRFNVNTRYYLAQPEVFAITHYPDDPMWTLTPPEHKMRTFESDSAFYYLDGEPYPEQTREGRACDKCDEYLALSPKEKQKSFEAHSVVLNPKNHFLVTESEYALGWMNQRETLGDMPDSLKLIYLDSAGANYREARASLMKGLRNVAVEHILQKRKNKQKMRMLTAENRQHKNFIRRRVNASINGQRTYKEIENRCVAFGHSYWNRREKMSHFRTGFKTYPKELTAKTIKKMAALQANKDKLDILYPQIEKKKLAFDSIIAGLSLNIWQQAFGLDTLSKTFFDRAKLRSLRKDNYKKPIEDLRRKINKVEFNYGYSLDAQVYQPQREAFKLFEAICKLIKLKNSLEGNCMNLQRDLVKIQQDPMGELETLKAQVVKGLGDDYCWLKARYPQVASVRRGFGFLRGQQLEVDLTIITENYAERYRHYLVNEENKRRYQQRRDIAIANKQSLRSTISNWKKYRSRVARKLHK